jgi:IS605 OrfB family transposase
MKRLGNREARYRRHVNHCISKHIVTSAKDTARGIAVENLVGIRERIRFRRSQRARMGGWAFNQLRQFIAYKAKLYGVVMVAIDPRNTSRTCAVCGHCEKANRKSQAEFECRACGYTAHADINAAVNIAAAGAAVNRPEISEKHQHELVA